MIARALAVAVALALTGCSGPGAQQRLQEAAENLAELRSGLIELRIEGAGPAPRGRGIDAIEVFGSFELFDLLEVPRADLRYTVFRRGGRSVRRLIVTGDDAFVVVDGQAYRLDEEHMHTILRASTRRSFLKDVPLGRWVSDPTSERGEGLDGEEVDRIVGRADLVAVVQGLLTIEGTFLGAPPSDLDADQVAALRAAEPASRIEVVVGVEGALPKRVLLRFDVADGVGRLSHGPVGALAESGLSLDLSISQPNRPIEVREPRGAVPIGELRAVAR